MRFPKELKTLKELFDEQLSDLSQFNVYASNVADFITNDQKCIDFINSIQFNKEEFFSQNDEIGISKGRARHSVISFLLGLSIRQFCKIFGLCSSIFNDEQISYLQINEPYINYKLWMYTSMNHDYGYYSEFLTKGNRLADLPIKYNVLDDNDNFNIESLKDFLTKYPKVLMNSYENIKDYYDYAQKFHKLKKDNEKVDHGILGGVLLFDRIMKKHNNSISNNKVENLSLNIIGKNFSYRDALYYKASCLTICQHNIFKSKNAKSDKQYGEKLRHLYHDSEYFIDIKHPLLLLLSLVDTIECVKTFSKKESQSRYFHTLTVLNLVQLGVDEDEIIIDFSNLAKKINEENETMAKEMVDVNDTKRKDNLIKDLNLHIKNIIGLDKWTCLNVEHCNKYRIRILYGNKNVKLNLSK